MKPSGPFFSVAVAVWILGATATGSLAQTAPYTGEDTGHYPCSVAGTLVVLSQPTGNLFAGGGGGGGGTGGGTVTATSIINDPQNPGFGVIFQPLLQGSGPTQFSFSGTV